MSVLRRWSEGVLEASWLLAVAATPIFFNIHTGSGSVPFGSESSKALLVRLLALLMAAAWIVRSVETEPAGPEPPRRFWRNPIMLPLLCYAGALCASAFISLAPAASFWGAPIRFDGVLTLAAYLVVFVTVAARLRRRESLERLLDVMVVTSVPVCLYSLVQKAGLDPIDWVGSHSERVFSMLGNPSFAGAYLVLLMPLTLAWGLESWRVARGRALLCATAFVLQLVALVLTIARGPWIAGVAGLFAFGVLAGAVRRRRLWTAVAFGPALAFGLFVLVLNVPRGPLEPLRGRPVLRRLAHLFDRATPSLSGRSRYLIWKTAFDLVRPRPPMLDAEGRPDRFHALRPILGYGLEAFNLAFASAYEVEFVRIERPRHLQSEEPLERQEEPPPLADRAHNEFWDSVVFGGWLGGVAHIALYASILALALRLLGLETGRDRWRFAGYLGIAGLLAGLAVSDAFSWPYLGVALPFGLAGAFILHALIATFRGEGTPEGPTPWLAIGLAAALLGNLIEVHLGLSVATSKLYFWLLTGLLVSACAEPQLLLRRSEAGAGEKKAPSPSSRSGEPLAHRLRRELPMSAPGGLLGAAFMVTLLFDFVKPSSVGLLATLMALVGGRRGPGQAVMLGLGLVTVGLVIALERRRGCRGWLAWVLALAVAFVFAAVQLQTVSAVRDAKNDISALEQFSRWVLPQYALLMLALALGIGAALGAPWDGSRLSVRGRAGVAVAILSLAAAVALAWPLALYKSEAESLLKIGAVFERSARYPVAAGLYERASELDPREPRYALHVGKAALLAAERPLPPAETASWMDLSEQAFERARALSPYDPGHIVNLARLDIRRAELAIPGQDEPYKEQAEALYARALRMAPNNVVLLDEYALFQLLRRGRLEDSERNLKRSLELDPDYFFTYTALGQLYVTRGQKGAGDKLTNYRTAIGYYDRSLRMQYSARTAVSLGLLSVEVEDKPTAVARLENALRFSPAPEAARKVHALLAQLYQALGQPEKAAAHAAQARLPPPGPSS
jgi:tetratricopeptide (TPR) repeat protein